jgi:hypothetical protein
MTIGKRLTMRTHRKTSTEKLSRMKIALFVKKQRGNYFAP